MNLIYFAISGRADSKSIKMKITNCSKKLYHTYFECAVQGDQDKIWDPNLCCLDFSNRLNKGWQVKISHCNLLYKWC